jgi:hypothetical protein
MTETELLPDTTTRRPERDGRRTDMVLIQVPAVRIRRARIEPGRSRRQAQGFGRPVGTRRPRRRLKREIRMAAFACLAFAPILLAASVWCLHPSRPLAAAEVATTSRTSDEPESTPAAVLISIEPAVSANESESETPVVFPGYLLPDDHREEPAHEGS